MPYWIRPSPPPDPMVIISNYLTRNAFCPTGEGGGVDPTCSPGKAGAPHTSRQSELNDIMVALLAQEAARQAQNTYANALAGRAKSVRLTPEEDRSVNRYRNTEAAVLNKDLRAGRGLDNEHLKNLDSAAEKYQTPIAGIVYRGCVHLPDLKPGDVVRDKAFLSTSVYLNIAKGFNDAGRLGTVMRIRVPQGQKSIWGNGNEYELVLPRNTPLRVVSVEGRSVVMEVVT